MKKTIALFAVFLIVVIPINYIMLFSASFIMGGPLQVDLVTDLIMIFINYKIYGAMHKYLIKPTPAES